METLENTGFYSWWFEHYADKDNCPLWSYYDNMAEYGCPCVTFLNEHADDAKLDDKGYWEKYPEDLDKYIKLYRTDLIHQIEKNNLYVTHINNYFLEKELKKLTEKDK